LNTIPWIISDGPRKTIIAASGAADEATTMTMSSDFSFRTSFLRQTSSSRNSSTPAKPSAPSSFVEVDSPMRRPDATRAVLLSFLMYKINRSIASARNALASPSSENSLDSRRNAKSTASRTPVASIAVVPFTRLADSIQAINAIIDRTDTSARSMTTSPPNIAPIRNASGA
jgi:FAD/FMN-containing dehydrogenase